MKLIDLLELFDENACIVVENANGEEVARYDGRDSIPEEYNDAEVLSINNSIQAYAVMIAVTVITINI